MHPSNFYFSTNLTKFIVHSVYLEAKIIILWEEVALLPHIPTDQLVGVGTHRGRGWQVFIFRQII